MAAPARRQIPVRLPLTTQSIPHLTFGPIRSVQCIPFFNLDRARNLRVFPEFRFVELESHCACGEVYFDVIGGIHNASFLAAGGITAKLIAGHDWSESLGPIEAWPASLKTTVGILLHSPVPIVLLWGEDGIMIYNAGTNFLTSSDATHTLTVVVVPLRHHNWQKEPGSRREPPSPSAEIS